MIKSSVSMQNGDNVKSRLSMENEDNAEDRLSIRIKIMWRVGCYVERS